jgi:hypothetical protein
MHESAFDSEDLLQRLLATHSQLLAGDQIDRESPRKWLLITREADVPGDFGAGGRWSIDHLFVDQDGIPTLVEVKRGTDTRIRREVVGQMLDYAANAVLYWPVDHVKSQFELSCSRRGASADGELLAFLGPEATPEDFWQKVKTNLQAGRVRMLFVADEIPRELRRIVEFLNEQMDPAEVLALEIRQFQGENLKTLVPTVIGQTAEAETRKGVSRSTSPAWTEQTFFEDMAKRGNSSDRDIARKIFDWARREVTEISWGRGKTVGTFIPVFVHDRERHQLFSLLSSGSLELYFYWYSYKPPFNDPVKAIELLDRFNRLCGLKLPAEALSRRPAVPLSHFAKPERLQALFDCFGWYLDEVRRAGGTPAA